MLVHFWETRDTASGVRVPIVGQLRFRRLADRIIPGSPDEAVRATHFPAPLDDDGKASVPLAEGYWEVNLYGDVGWGPIYVQVGAGASADWPDLVRVDPATLAPAQPAVPAWEAAVSAVEGYAQAAADSAALAASEADSVEQTIADEVQDWLAANPPAGSGAYPVQQVSLTADLAYSLPVGAPTDQVVGVVFTQPEEEPTGYTVTYGGSPLTVTSDAGASTLVEFFHDGTAWEARVLTTTTPPDLSGYVPTSRTVNGQALTGDITLDAADVGALPDTYTPDLSGYTPTSGLADVATTGAYADLTGKPTIPDSPDDIGAAAASHTHDDRYYTETEADARFAPAAQPINAQTGTAYTLVASDASKLVTLTNSGAITVTVPAGVFTAGQRVDIGQRGAGAVTTVAGAGMTVNPPPGGSLVAEGQFAYWTLLFISATEADVIGMMASA